MTRLEHLLTILQEECAETAHRVSKALRFGLQEIQPDMPPDYENQPEVERNNAHRIAYEMADLLGVYEMLHDAGLVPTIRRDWCQAKRRKVEKFLEYSRKVGTLQGDNVRTVPVNKCGDCDTPAVYVRRTQFAGDHWFCATHATEQNDFMEDDSSTLWERRPSVTTSP